MDECAHIERISGVDNDHTAKYKHGLTPISFNRHIIQMGLSCAKTPHSYLGENSAQTGSQGRS